MSRRLRSLIGIFVLLFGLGFYALLVTGFAIRFGGAPIWLETGYYLVFGVLWIFPARLLIRWMNREPR